MSEAPPRLARPAAWLAPALVWTIWALMLAGNLLFAAKYSNPLPGPDEWNLLASLPEPVTLAWAWEQYSEHRVPLAKLLWIGVLQVTDYDFRLGTFLSVLMLAATAFAMLRAARALRGRTALTDAFFPLALLSFGQPGNITWWWTINHLLAPFAACAMLLAILRLRPSPREGVGGPTPFAPWYGFLAAACLVLLPLCGPGGLPYALALAPWLGWWGVRQWRQGARGTGLAALGSSVVGVLLVGFYFYDYQSAKSVFPNPPSLATCLNTAVQLLGVGFGTAAKPLYWLWGGGTLILGALSAAGLLLAWRNKWWDRSQIAGLLGFLAAVAGLVLVVARNRAAMGVDYIFLGTYLPMMIPLLCCVYLVWEAIGAPAVVARTVQLSLFTAVCILFWPNLHSAMEGASLQRTAYRQLEEDIRKGLPSYVLAERYLLAPHCGLSTEDAETVVFLFHELDKRGVRTVKLRKEPPYEAVLIPTLPSNAMHLTIENDVFRGVGGDPAGAQFLEYRLSEPQFVYAIRIRYAYYKAAGDHALLRVFWSQSGRNEFTDDGSSEERSITVFTVVNPGHSYMAIDEDGKVRPDTKLGHAERPQTVYVNDTIDRFRIYPNLTLCDFRVARLELFVPVKQAPPPGSGP